VHALPGTIAALKAHVFNNVIWPDFSRIPTPQAPFITFHEIQVGQTLELGGKRIEVLPAVHTVPACGYAVTPARAAGSSPATPSATRPSGAASTRWRSRRW
jgi:hypothetical protein